ncbi:MAG: glycosyltransferase family 1 protein [Chloroflexi bacterium]|nr:glycosyltransferase family 1 protein [Chloroflexota bacterium]
MASFWFVSAPLFSHLDWGGYLRTAQALQARGHQVTWVSENTIAGALASAGVPFAPIRKSGWLWPPPPAPDVTNIPPQEAVMLRYRRALDTWLSEPLVGEAVEALLELAAQIGKPDVIVTDPFLSAAALAAEALDVKLAVCGWPALRDLNEELLFPVQRTLGTDSRERLDRLQARFGLRGANFAPGPTPSILSPHLHISYFSATWYQSDQASLLPQTLFVGGAPTPPTDPPPDWLAALPDDAPLGLVTLGTTFTGDLGFFSWSAQALARVGIVPIVVIGWNPLEPDKKAELIAALPKRTRLLNFVSFPHLLPRLRLMVHHGGMGTTHWGLVYGVPQLVVPHAADQRGQARRVAQAKVGIELSAHDVRQGMLFEGVRALATDDRVRQTAADLAAEFAALGGPPRAAEALAALVT